MSVSVTMTIQAGQGKLDELKEKLCANLVATRAFTGCEMISLVEPHDKRGVLLLIEQWEQIENFDAYKKWRTESNTSVLSGELVAEPPTVVVSNVLF